MGGRKGKGCRFNLFIFIINGIIHDVLKTKNRKPILLQIYDYAKMFYSINLQQAIIDIFETGLNYSNLQLISISICSSGFYWKGDNKILLWSLV